MGDDSVRHGREYGGKEEGKGVAAAIEGRATLRANPDKTPEVSPTAINLRRVPAKSFPYKMLFMRVPSWQPELAQSEHLSHAKYDPL